MSELKYYACVFCGDDVGQWGNNPNPVKDEGRCCDNCNLTIVIPARLWRLNIKGANA